METDENLKIKQISPVKKKKKKKHHIIMNRAQYTNWQNAIVYEIKLSTCQKPCNKV